MLNRDEISRRIVAARTLRGLKQRELANRAAAQGLGSEDVPQLERGERPFTAAARMVLARVLDIPEEWFTAPLNDVIGAPSEDSKRLREIEKNIEALLASRLIEAGGDGESGASDEEPGQRRARR